MPRPAIKTLPFAPLAFLFSIIGIFGVRAKSFESLRVERFLCSVTACLSQLTTRLLCLNVLPSLD